LGPCANFVNHGESSMHKFVHAIVRLAALLPPALVASSSVSAWPLPIVAVQRAGLKAVEDVACFGYGWRGWGVYPGWFRPACTGAYVAPDYVAPAPAYVPAYAPAYPAAGRCWVPPGPDGRPGYWAAC
jgi:hypothetical protein